MSNETDAERKARLDLQAKSASLIRRIKLELPPDCGATLFIFNYGDRGALSYASTADRQDMIKVIKEWLAHVEGVS